MIASRGAKEGRNTDQDRSPVRRKSDIRKMRNSAQPKISIRHFACWQSELAAPVQAIANLTKEITKTRCLLIGFEWELMALTGSVPRSWSLGQPPVQYYSTGVDPVTDELEASKSATDPCRGNIVLDMPACARRHFRDWKGCRMQGLPELSSQSSLSVPRMVVVLVMGWGSHGNYGP